MSKTTMIQCGGTKRAVESVKAGYPKLVDYFVRECPDLMERYERNQAHARGLPLFARTVDALFTPSSPQRSNDSAHALLACGWYALTWANAAKMFKDLHALAKLAGLKYGIDWDLIVDDPTPELVKARAEARGEVDTQTVLSMVKNESARRGRLVFIDADTVERCERHGFDVEYMANGQIEDYFDRNDYE